METGTIELNVETDRWARRQKREEKKDYRLRRCRWPSLERTFAWRRDAGSPTLPSRVFAPENSRSSYVTGSRGRSYGEVTMREDGCRLSDATLDKYLYAALLSLLPSLLPPPRFAPRHQSGIGSYLSRFVYGNRGSSVVARTTKFHERIRVFTGSRSPRERRKRGEREGRGILRDPLYVFLPCADGENAQLQCSCVCVSLSLRFRVR